MPYIDPEIRKEIDPLLKPLLNVIYTNKPGNVNYIISRVIHEFIMDGQFNYKKLNEAIGILECAKMELYRIICAPYENKKRTINGAISELDKKYGGNNE